MEDKFTMYIGIQHNYIDLDDPFLGFPTDKKDLRVVFVKSDRGIGIPNDKIKQHAIEKAETLASEGHTTLICQVVTIVKPKEVKQLVGEIIDITPESKEH